MKYVAAYALLKLGGNADPSAADVEGYLRENGVKADPEMTKLLIEKFSGKDFNELIAIGNKKMASMGPAVSVAPVVVAQDDSKAKDMEPIIEEKTDIDFSNLFGGEDEDY